MKWMNLPDEYSTEDATFAIIPIAYEGKVTYGTGASKGAEEIITASKHLEYYEDQFNNEPFIEGIQIITPKSFTNTEEMITNVSEKVSQQKGKFIIGLGGDHTATLGTIKGLEKNEKDFSVVIFDAHSDFRDEWNGTKNNHACVTKRIYENHHVTVMGVRAQDKDEYHEIKESKNIQQISMYDLNKDSLMKALPNMKDKIFISIDVDVFDPSFIKNTGTPEPGGLMWTKLIDMLTILFKEKKVIGTDIVEFAPEENFRSEAYSLARLVYKMMSLYVKNEHSRNN